MLSSGTLDKAVAAALPVVDGPVTVPTPDQTKAASKYLQENWAAAVG
jgi:putative spermidine/putrescine transport system substrate-binding protein